ncbi:NDP-hexose 2,3-dehydratase family protein [Nonomuraea insulae]|uniref:NDP-hexose 2,3-dehydratase family protein n=1 Tax=Nonomuraea insulae TaxID=1616787 RepID=A0ABW1D0L9_9ACTN
MPVRTRTPLHERLLASAFGAGGRFATAAEFQDWLARAASRTSMETRRVPLAGLTGWRADERTGDLRHHSGRFFRVHGLDVRLPQQVVPSWSQPIIDQPEIGVLGILVKEIDGTLHCLMQAKREPGNHNGVQLSPTVQATRSNYTRVHQGRAVPYLEHFRDAAGPGVIADIRQSEQGAWFYRKRNRNMVVEAAGDVEAAEGFCWLTLGQVHRLMAVPDLVNMDARTVLACLPLAGPGLARSRPPGGFLDTLARSYDPAAGSHHPTGEILRWITEMRTSTDLHTRPRPLGDLPGWRHADGAITHDSGRFFGVIGVSVRAQGREVAAWDQPMIEPVGTGVVAFLVRRIDGVLHVLMHARAEPGYADVIELAPTVQCVPGNYDLLPDAARPPFLGLVLAARPPEVRYDTILSEEGGRFHRARNRYLVVETTEDLSHPEYRWVAQHQIAELLRHSFYVNVQARSLYVCLTSLVTAPHAEP